MSPKLRALVWVGSSRRDLKAMPTRVARTFGFALYLAQVGGKHSRAKPLHGFGSGVLEVVEDWKGSTYRAAYTVRFKDAVFVLHVFQKKAKVGIATPKPDLDLIGERLKAAKLLAEGIQ